MKTKLFLTMILSGSFFTGSIFADRVLGVMNEFTKAEEYIVNKMASKDFRDKTLGRNLETAVKSSLQRTISTTKMKDKAKDINASKIKFEQQKGTFNYYISYDQYVMYYNYSLDPELYLQMPTDERVYVKPDEKEMERAKALEAEKGKDQPANTSDAPKTDAPKQ